MSSFVNLGRQPRIDPPYPAWPGYLVDTLEAAIKVAMHRVATAQASGTLLSAKENELTNWLQAELWLLLDEADTVPGFSYDVFDKPERGAESEDFSGALISKKPDLVFYRHGNPSRVIDARQDGWFCECKILDSSHSRNDYIHLGIMRFVEGAYAWAVPMGQMIAFVRHPANEGWEPEVHLLSYMKKIKTTVGKTHEVITALTGDTRAEDRVLVTHHDRRFLLRNGRMPGSIALRHIWIQVV